MNGNIEVKSTGWHFTMVPNTALLDTELSSTSKCVFVSLCSFMDSSGGGGYPSYRKIAERASCSKRAAISAIERLVLRGHVIKEYRYNTEGEQTSNVYRIVTNAPPSESGAPGVVNDVHPPSELGAPELEPVNENQLNERESTPPSKKKTAKKVTIEYDGYKLPVGKKRMDTIIADFGESVFYRYLDRIIRYCESRNKWPYKDYAATMWNWIQDDIAKGKGPQKRQQETKPKINVHELAGGYYE